MCLNISDSTGTWSHPRREAEQLQKAKVVSSGEQHAVFSERGGVDHAERRPDSLTGGTQNGGPGGPVHLAQLQTNRESGNAVREWKDGQEVGQEVEQEVDPRLTSATLMFCLRPRGASKNSCSLAPVFTCKSLPVYTHTQVLISCWTEI